MVKFLTSAQKTTARHPIRKPPYSLCSLYILLLGGFASCTQGLTCSRHSGSELMGELAQRNSDCAASANSAASVNSAASANSAASVNSAANANSAANVNSAAAGGAGTTGSGTAGSGGTSGSNSNQATNDATSAGGRTGTLGGGNCPRNLVENGPVWPVKSKNAILSRETCTFVAVQTWN